MSVLTRFAPAPTGALHLGHVANAIYVWGLAGNCGGRVLLRIEDHDRQRARREYEAALLDDLDWLGFAPDVHPTSTFRAGACESRQSDRGALYGTMAERLRRRGLLYGCTCSRKMSTASSEGAGAHRCRSQHAALDGNVAWRLRVDEEIVERFVDVLRGPSTQRVPAFADPVIRDRLGNWTYQFAVVADDHLQEIDLVIRGEDLLASTALQIWMARVIGRATPARFAHHPLVMKSATQKLSKSDGDTGIAELRHAGMRPAEVIGLAAHTVGLTPSTEPIDASDVRTLFAGLRLLR